VILITEILPVIVQFNVMNTTEFLLQTWSEPRTRFSNLLNKIKPEDLAKKLPDTRNSAGFIIRHVAELEFLSAKTFFGYEHDVMPKTLIAQRDTGEWTDLNDLISYQQESHDILKASLENLAEDEWSKIIESKVFGSKTKAEVLGRTISHTAYHAGQLRLILKYGTNPNTDTSVEEVLGTDLAGKTS
jgi:hypothetical protein